MGKDVHGHKVRHMAIESGESFTKDSLIAAINEKFGLETTFYSCAKENMTAAELIEFFEKAGKLSAPDYNFSESADHVCKHNREE